MSDKTVAFIGLGNLGFPIARNLVDDGYHLKLFDLQSESDAVTGLVARGAEFAESRKRLVEGVGCVVTLLPDSETVLDTYLGTDGLLPHLAPGTRCIEMTSGYPEATRRLGAALEDIGARLIDAPICNGAVPGAYERRLVHLVGGEREDFEACRELLGASAREVIHVGPLGTGHAMKTVNNSVAATFNVAVAEGLALLAACGVPPERAIEHLAECSINGSGFERAAEAFRRDWDAPPSFRLALQRKDMRYAARLAAELGLPHPVGDAAHGVLLDAERAGFGDADWSQAAFRRYGLTPPSDGG